MSYTLTPAAALATVPGWEGAAAAITPLSGGLSNRSFRVVRDDHAFVLRLDAEYTRRLGVDRRRERDILLAAEREGLGPDVVYAAPDDGILLTRYVEGATWDRAALCQPHKVAQLAALLRRVHAMPLCGSRFDAGAIGATYLTSIDRTGPLYRMAASTVEELRHSAAAGERTLCHNDLVVSNVIGDPPTLIDWEYASDNDPAFDLASLIEYHELSAAAAERLVAEYAGRSDASLEERVRRQRRIYLRITALWFAARGSEQRARELLSRVT